MMRCVTNLNQENYCALALSIVIDCFPETAFAKLESPRPDTINKIILPEDISLMERYRKRGLTYKQIGNIFGLHKDVVYSRIKRSNVKIRKDGEEKRIG